MVLLLRPLPVLLLAPPLPVLLLAPLLPVLLLALLLLAVLQVAHAIVMLSVVQDKNVAGQLLHVYQPVIAAASQIVQISKLVYQVVVNLALLMLHVRLEVFINAAVDLVFLKPGVVQM